MVEKSINRLIFLTDEMPKLLNSISDEIMSQKLNPEKWSKKEILGHLIDSATNNHQRFIRGQFETNPEIRYDQNNWNKYNCYQEIESSQLISFWTIYNQHLIEVMKRIPSNNLTKKIKVGNELPTIEFLIIDYIEHLEHHLKQLVGNDL
jgi:hypothetical protein